jgi:hypothetical protein
VLGAVEEISIDIERAHELIDALEQVIDHPFFDDSERLALSVVLAETSFELAFSVRLLCASDQLIGASVCLRSQFEALIRSVWAFHCANDSQISNLSKHDLSPETQQQAKSIPQANGMLEELLTIPNLRGFTSAITEFRDLAWQPLNSFVHSGIHAIHRTKFGAPPHLIQQTFKISNGFCFLAYNHLGILTGIPDIQNELFSATGRFSSVLPDIRVGT